MRSLCLLIALFLGMVAAVWGGWCWFDLRRSRGEVEQAEKDMAAGRYRPARQRLSELTKRRPGFGEAAYQLGLCEQKLGHGAAALAAWSSVGPGSPSFVKASIGRARILVGTGRLTIAEEVLASLPAGSGPDADQILKLREYLLRLEGRTQEAREVIVDSWPGAPEPSSVLKRLYIFEDPAFPLDHVKQTLKSGDPKDDRVWLGQANIAIWQGRSDDAARWLDACLERRPHDQAVWLAKLSLAMSLRDVRGAGRSVEHVQAAWFLPFEVLRLRAWFAGFRGDLEVERQSLVALLAEEPGNTGAWARLAELAIAAGRATDAQAFRKKQAEASDLRERYIQLFMRDDRSQHADEMARLAQKLGHGSKLAAGN